ncbi:DUF2637 domain-containing protein [Thermomonospora umbrina]|uniref:Uncharacterized protein DUF2637 n=1 Tax=Thermomonospora umbrina TaxID=111806 RepID=A0A3D9T2R5_9ACTN|nr:DUF2637 domain-containing protein [Thermomonospora umbrina]REF00654.1 uncharacterized protein DUF2637 [Thermomonospora umbrina]
MNGTDRPQTIGNARASADGQIAGDGIEPPSSWPVSVRVAILVEAPLVTALAVLGGVASFHTVRDVARPWFGGWAWVVPVGIDVGIIALLAWDLLMEYLNIAWPVLRWVAWTFIGATIYLNVTAARGEDAAVVIHAAMPTLFIVTIEGIRHLLRRSAGLTGRLRIEGIPMSRRVLAPWSSWALHRRMVLWHITTYQDGLRLEYERLQTVCRLQESYGRWRWHWKAPLRERLALRLHPAQITANVQRPAAQHPGSDAARGPGTDPPLAKRSDTGRASTAGRAAGDVFHPQEGNAAAGDTMSMPATSPPARAAVAGRHDRSSRPGAAQTRRRSVPARGGAPEGRAPDERDAALVKAAQNIIAVCRSQGISLTQSELGRRLREEGHSIANGRLAWLSGQVDPPLRR